MCFGLSKIIKEFKNGSVTVVGMKGRGKDMLMANVIARRKEPYISLFDYDIKKVEWQKLDFKKIDINNTYKDFLQDNVKYYKFPYIKGSDIYLTDCGVYFPAQYCNELNRDFKSLPIFMALSRQVGGGTRVHANCQNLNRIWDKVREMSDCYIYCNRCIYLWGLVIQVVTVYDKYQSCVDRVEPFKPMSIPFLASQDNKTRIKTSNEEALRRYRECYGRVERKLLIYVNKSKYNTNMFEELLEGGKKESEMDK